MADLTEHERQALKDPRVREGARIESELRWRGMPSESRDAAEYMHILLEQGTVAFHAAAQTAYVFAGGVPWRDRWRACWRILRSQ